ncbi:MAG: hypothetical protein ABID54_00590 [Pseudomonadota bacterium]
MNIDWPESMEDRKVIGLLDQIQEIRARNNKHWMGILRLAFREAPEESKALMREITKYDGQISELTRQLGGMNEKEEEEGDPDATSSASHHNW